MEVVRTLHATEYLKSDRDIEIHKSVVPKHYPLHCHDFIEIAYIADGRGRHIIEDEAFEIDRGDLFIFNENVRHELFAYAGYPLVVYNVIFKPVFIDFSFQECKDFVDMAYQYLIHTFYAAEERQSYIKMTGLKHENIELLMEEMMDEFICKQDGYLQVIKADLMKLLILVFRLYRSDAQQRQNSNVYKKLLIQNTLDYMKKNYAADLSCDKLAGRVYLSTSYFSKIFKEETNRTVIQVLQRLRISAACEKLQKTSLPINAIMLDVGYSDIKYFYQVFKGMKKMTPGEYRSRKLARIS